MTLLDEFLESLKYLSSEQLIQDIEQAREDSKNSYLLDELPNDAEKGEANTIEIDTFTSPSYTAIEAKEGHQHSQSSTESMNAPIKKETKMEKRLTHSMQITQRGIEAA